MNDSLGQELVTDKWALVENYLRCPGFEREMKGCP